MPTRWRVSDEWSRLDQADKEPFVGSYHALAEPCPAPVSVGPRLCARQPKRRMTRHRGVTFLRLAAGAMMFAIAGCSSGSVNVPVAKDSPVGSQSLSTSTPNTPSPSSVANARPTLAQIVHDPKSTLYAVSIHPSSAGGYTVSAWWSLLRGNNVYDAIVTSDDRFASAHYEAGGWHNWAKYQTPTTKVPGPAIQAFKGLVASPVRSLAPETRAFVAGGDGATLLPFDAVARSVGGGGWQGFVIPKTHGDQAYDDGELVLPDGRFLALLNDWSSDRGWRKPGPEYHGLWISAGADWAHYKPFRPAFAPGLGASDAVNSITPQPSAGLHGLKGLVLATTRSNMLYVSTDGAATFRRVRAR